MRAAWRGTRRRWTCVVSLLCLGVLSLEPTVTRAQPLPIAWHVPPGCPSLADVSSWLEAVVPAELRGRLGGIEAEVRITRVERVYHAAIRVAHGAWSGEREVEGRRCEEVARSAIVVISVSLAEAVEIAEAPPPVPPEVQERVEPPITDVPPTPPVPPAPEPPSVVVVEEPRRAAPIAPPPAPLPRLLIDGSAGVAFGVGTRIAAPHVTVGAHLPVHRAVTIGARVGAVPCAAVRAQEASADVALVVVGLEGCGRHALSHLHIVGCLRMDAGALVADGSGLETTSRGHAPYVALAMAPAVEFGARYRFRLSGQLDVRLVRPSLAVEGIGTIYRSSTVGGTLDLGLVILIP